MCSIADGAALFVTDFLPLDEELHGLEVKPKAYSHQGAVSLQNYSPCLQQRVFQGQLESGVGPVSELHLVSVIRNGAHHLVPHMVQQMPSVKDGHVFLQHITVIAMILNRYVLLIQDLDFMQC